MRREVHPRGQAGCRRSRSGLCLMGRSWHAMLMLGQGSGRQGKEACLKPWQERAYLGKEGK